MARPYERGAAWPRTRCAPARCMCERRASTSIRSAAKPRHCLPRSVHAVRDSAGSVTFSPASGSTMDSTRSRSTSDLDTRLDGRDGGDRHLRWPDAARREGFTMGRCGSCRCGTRNWPPDRLDLSGAAERGWNKGERVGTGEAGRHCWLLLLSASRGVFGDAPLSWFRHRHRYRWGRHAQLHRVRAA